MTPWHVGLSVGVAHLLAVGICKARRATPARNTVGILPWARPDDHAHAIAHSLVTSPVTHWGEALGPTHIPGGGSRKTEVR